MDDEKRKAVEAAGYQIFDDAADWLGLSQEEKAEVDLRSQARKIAVKMAKVEFLNGKPMTPEQIDGLAERLYQDMREPNAS